MDDDRLLGRFRRRAEQATKDTVIPDAESGQTGYEHDLQRESQHDHGVQPYIPMTVHDRTSSNEPSKAYFRARFWPTGWRN